MYVLGDAAKQFALPPVDKKVVFNGVSLDEEACPLKRDRPYIFGVGRLVKNKGFDFLIEGFAKLADEFPNHDLVIAGEGDHQDELTALARKLEVLERVKLVGKVGRQEVATLFAGCELFVLPSPLEPFGIVCLEAMRAGKPVIATRAGGPLEFIKEGEDGLLVASENADELATAIRQLLLNPELRLALGGNAKAHVNDFSWQKIASEYKQTYNLMLSTS